MNIAVIGAGKMGLPLACQFASRGGRVAVCDIQTDVVDAINRGQCPIDEPGVGEVLAKAVRDGRLRATANTSDAVHESDVVVVIVPVLLTAERDADTSIIESVSRQIAAGLRPGTLISYETTLPLGGTRRLLPILESTGLRGGQDFDLVFSPERVKSRRVLERLMDTPKVVGGITPKAAARAEEFYGRYLGASIINVGTLEAAELVKLAGMVYRDVNIALANELAGYAESVGVDLYPVIDAANTDDESSLLRPGIGVGGHCTPVYPYFLIRDAERRNIPLSIVESSRQLSEKQPARVLDRLERIWDSLCGRRVLILGLGFRPEVKEHICSPAYNLRDELVRRGAKASIHDPLYSQEELRDYGFTACGLDDMPTPEVIILNTAHSAYSTLDFSRLAKQGLQVVVDGRALWRSEQVHAAGLIYIGVGQPDEISTRSIQGTRQNSGAVAQPL